MDAGVLDQNSMALPLGGRCGQRGPALPRTLKDVLTKLCHTLARTKSKVLSSALILHSCKNTVKSIPRAGFQSPNCCRNGEAQGAKVSFASPALEPGLVLICLWFRQEWTRQTYMLSLVPLEAGSLLHNEARSGCRLNTRVSGALGARLV